jgi:hypothetical protein
MTIDLTSDLTGNNTAYCFHKDAIFDAIFVANNWYRISVNFVDDGIYKTELRISGIKTDFIDIIQFPILKKTRIISVNKRGDYTTLLHLNSLMNIDYKNIPKLKEKLSTYILFS